MLLIDVFKDLFEDLLEDLLEKPKLQNIPLNKVVSTFLVLYLLELKDSAQITVLRIYETKIKYEFLNRMKHFFWLRNES